MPGGIFVAPAISSGLDYGSVSSFSSGTSATSGTANVKGNWAQLTAATTADAIGILVMLNYTDISLGCCGDIGVGGAGSEVVIIQNLTFTAPGDAGCYSYYFPISIPSGTRVAWRVQSTTGARSNFFCSILLVNGESLAEGAAGVDSIGYTTSSNSISTSVDPGTTINTKGSYAQLTASTTRDYIGFVVGFDDLNDGTGEFQPVYLVDIAIGAAASEVVILPNLRVMRRGVSVYPGSTPFFPIKIPAGTRLSARAQCSANNPGHNPVGLALYAVY